MREAIGWILYFVTLLGLVWLVCASLVVAFLEYRRRQSHRDYLRRWPQ